MKSLKKNQKLHSGEDTPTCSNTISSRYNLRPRKRKQPQPSPPQDLMKKTTGTNDSPMDFGTDKDMSDALPKSDDRKVSGSAVSFNVKTRKVTEESRGRVITPQVNDGKPTFFAHNIT